MNILIKVKKLGNHWYPDLYHDDPIDLILDRKIEKFCTLLDKEKVGELKFLLSENHSWINENAIQFEDADIWKWLNTTAVFPIKMYIGDHVFEVSSLLMDLFEEQFNTNFHKTFYSISLYNF